MCELLVLMPTQFSLSDSVVDMPLHPLLAPCLEMLHLRARLHEILHLHLLELTHPKDELPRHDLIPKSLANLRDAEGDLLPGCFLREAEIHKDPLCRLRPQIDAVLLVRDRSDVRLKHQVELSDFGPIEGAGIWTTDFLLDNDVIKPSRHIVAIQRLHELLSKRFGSIRLTRLLELPDVRLDAVIRPIPALRGFIVAHRIVERIHVPRCLPHGRMHQNGSIEALDVVVPIDHVMPPALLYVALQLHAERAVVVRGAESSIDFRGRKDESAPLRK